MQFEHLAGLIGEGPLPKHYHLGRPTPWREGYVVKFTGLTGESWIGNFQTGHSYHSEILLWSEAQSFVVIAAGACYLVSAEYPDKYFCHQSSATGVLFNEDRTKIFVADYSDLYACDRTGSILWVCENLGVDGVVLTDCTPGFINGSACYDPPEHWKDFKVSEIDGALN